MENTWQDAQGNTWQVELQVPTRIKISGDKYHRFINDNDHMKFYWSEFQQTWTGFFARKINNDYLYINERASTIKEIAEKLNNLTYNDTEINGIVWYQGGNYGGLLPAWTAFTDQGKITIYLRDDNKYGYIYNWSGLDKLKTILQENLEIDLDEHPDAISLVGYAESFIKVTEMALQAPSKFINQLSSIRT